MPLYEYQCESCQRRFEKIQKFSDPPVDVCPHCGGGPVKKLLSSPAIQFKGSGWYVTDYARKPAGDGGKSSGSGTSSSSTSSSTSDTPASTSKPADSGAKKD
ncbi:MAG: zinc ribbon domain-containing protein [Acidobacteria bacterium]|nr:zinc ribbon domain-containing protein [Acidobacteriota bacterium]